MKLTESHLRELIRSELWEASWENPPDVEPDPQLDRFKQLLADYMDSSGVPQREEVIETPTTEHLDGNMRVVMVYDGKRMSFGGGTRGGKLIFVRYK